MYAEMTCCSSRSDWPHETIMHINEVDKTQTLVGLNLTERQLTNLEYLAQIIAINLHNQNCEYDWKIL